MELVHSLNGSSLALPRIVAALLENNQTENNIKLPEVLHKYFGSDAII
jgi:seryl-tRNA synthetase